MRRKVDMSVSEKRSLKSLPDDDPLSGLSCPQICTIATTAVSVRQLIVPDPVVAVATTSARVSPAVVAVAALGTTTAGHPLGTYSRILAVMPAGFGLRTWASHR
jgi:hypothetical protein